MEPQRPMKIDDTTQPGAHGSALVPEARFLRLGRSVRLPKKVREENHFTIVRLQSPIGLDDRVTKGSAVAALLVSVSLRTLTRGNYQLWSDCKLLRNSHMPAFYSNVMDFDASPACWSGSAFDFVHYHLPRECVDDVACDWGVSKAGNFRQSVVENDLVIAQLTRNLLPSITRRELCSSLALDQLQLVLAAHLLQRYGSHANPQVRFKGGLAPWQKRCAAELLVEHLDGKVRLTRLATECGLSVSQFARCFKASFGMSSHQWLVTKRVDRAKELLRQTTLPLTDIAVQSGFGDQARFTRSFHSIVGTSPGRWRRHQGTIRDLPNTREF